MERLTRDGVALAFEDVGKGAPPIVLIHDLGCDHTALQPQLEHFRGWHRVVAADLLGHGQSDQLTQPYTLSGFADDLAWLCHELGVYRPIAAGQGIGGMIAIELAGRCPDLLAAVVALEAPLRRLPEAGAGSQEISVHRRTAAHQEVVCALEAGGRRLTKDSQQETFVAAIATPPHLAATCEKAMVWDGAAALARCTAPMLYVQSHASDAAVERLRTLCPGIVVEMVRLGHLDQREAAAQINALIDTFLLGSLAGSVRSDGREEVGEGR
ncbi:MAG TPA: alpha/beta hydrolase [Roseiflexaceae bacterium]|nr:alpha/beta hydrolase [Roseiflexaceae bacterium]